jgi:hypothetical protein
MLVVETAMVTTLIVPWRGSASGWDRRGRRRRVGAVVEAVEEVRRLACDHDDRPGGAEAHDLVGGQQRAAVAVFVAAGDRGPGFECLAGVARAVGGLKGDRVVAQAHC